MPETDKERRERERAHWKYRAVKATNGPNTRLGAILLAVLKKQRGTLPRFASSAVVTSDGFILCTFTTREGVIHNGAFVGSVADLVANFRGLADHLKLTDAERTEMFNAVRGWIAHDYRPDTELLGGNTRGS